MQIFELTHYNHVALFVDSHPKFTCQKQSVSKTPPLHGAEVRERRLTHQIHQMSSERRQKKCKYLNLLPIVMSDCSLIATRNVHAKHNKLVCHVGYTVLRYEKEDSHIKDIK